MRIQKNRNLEALFLVLALTVALVVVAVPTVKAQGISTTSHAYASPDPVEPGHAIWVGGYVTPAPPSGYPYYGISVTVTRPDGMQTVFGPLTSDPSGAAVIMYYPSQIGDYGVKFDFPGNYLGPYEDYYYPSSDTTSFSCQELLPVASFTFNPGSPLVDQTVTFDGSGSYDLGGGYIVSYSWRFGDGATGYGVSPSHSYSSAGDYIVRLTVMDNDNKTGSTTLPITVRELPTAHFNFDPESPQVDETVTFDASSSSDPDGNIVSYDWDYGDQTTGYGKTSTHAYSAEGTYTVSLIVTDNDGLKATTTDSITVKPKTLPPEASFTSSPQSPEEDETVTFNASGSTDTDGTIVSYEWNFGDQTTGSGMTASHSYSSAGTYTVTLTVTDNDDQTDTATQTITIIEPQLEPPEASFTSSPQSPEEDETVTFNASGSTDTDGTIVSYEWNFGDQTTGTGATTTHTYSSAGTYTVTLAVTDNDGLTDTATKSITINPAPTIPDPSFTFPSGSQGANQPITFDASGSSDPDGTIVNYSWDFGDGTTGTGMTAPHTYSSAGTYTVTLAVTDNDGHTETTTKSIVISSPTTAPNASFTFPSETQVVHQAVTFDASGSSDPDGTIVNYSWDFGDGTTGTGMTSTHAYTSAGTYTVTLTVTDNDGHTDTATQSIEIIPDTESPIADAGEDLVVKDGKTVTFNASRSTDNADIISYDWDFGDGTTGTGETPTHTYKKGGTYSVTLTVTDASGNTDAFILVITVEEPAAGFPAWVLIPIILALIVAAVVVWYFLKKKKKEAPKPTKIKMTVDKTEILADGNSTANITIELQDEKGKPISALADTKIEVTTTGGTIKSPVVNVPKGKEKGTTVLISSTAAGKVMLSATAKGLKKADATVRFVEKARFCMHCGSKMSFTSKYCPECGKSPPAGVDTKACKNCNAVIPAVANFCAECGAGQPKEE